MAEGAYLHLPLYGVVVSHHLNQAVLFWFGRHQLSLDVYLGRLPDYRSYCILGPRIFFVRGLLIDRQRLLQTLTVAPIGIPTMHEWSFLCNLCSRLL